MGPPNVAFNLANYPKKQRFRIGVALLLKVNEVEHPGQQAERKPVFLSGPGRRRATFKRRPALPRDVREGFHPNDLKRYSLGTKNSKTLQRGADGPHAVRRRDTAGGRSEVELAASAQWRVLTVCPLVLARGGDLRRTLDAGGRGWQLEASIKGDRHLRVRISGRRSLPTVRLRHDHRRASECDRGVSDHEI